MLSPPYADGDCQPGGEEHEALPLPGRQPTHDLGGRQPVEGLPDYGPQK